MNVAPYDLLKQSIWWQDKALIAIAAETKAQQIIQKQQGLK